ncbi:transcriptional regulator, HxlR family [Chitinophaga ginsengisegetis]|uniref:Transcriptional regulator, HxlR family n=1 Tax=Chitinophaga ginsengisegetis TaxID=393003 RepID=A0A1T5PD32_9BACT|nr:helix-turn-helix domain-containing protein [Chitinophaga ginsengisegetis]MDR6569141.1 DNA-binding HxlR family transcriptional regulator [Chitinophaga ginsengisegetis]MDR6648830.1 DNA-binding HxlR family transcriptional regulator [Chitinophaga ginsengisegetis]MDR6655222.1 DNA-binding HxlR family transcriptional regulator [Chitinophaga ginsengisegetis]SKD10498.1 transcriptional regulator, HxlR family [Chitinophaga ginsengisegetis]
MECKPESQIDRKKEMMAIHDAMDVLSGKWKIYIISSICHYNKRRFSDILNDVVGISNKMLSKELKELEINQLVERTVLDTHPVTVQYELTKHGKTLQTIINNLTDWGKEHRKKIIAKK